jgi:hypothetical protein
MQNTTIEVIDKLKYNLFLASASACDIERSFTHFISTQSEEIKKELENKHLEIIQILRKIDRKISNIFHDVLTLQYDIKSITNEKEN